MSGRTFNVLFLCTGNSARSIMAEALLNHVGDGRFKAHSAGSHPIGRVHPLALDVLDSLGVASAGLRSKSWDEFAGPAAVPVDFVLTVCGRAAGEACPIWPGSPIRAHWGVDDPAAAEGSEAERREAFRAAAMILRRRIERLMRLSDDVLLSAGAGAALREIGNE